MKDGQLEGWIPAKLWESAYYCAPAWLWLIYWDYKLEKHFLVWKVFLMDTLPPDSNFILDSFDDFIIWIVKAAEFIWSLRPVIKILEKLGHLIGTWLEQNRSCPPLSFFSPENVSCSKVCHSSKSEVIRKVPRWAFFIFSMDNMHIWAGRES